MFKYGKISLLIFRILNSFTSADEFMVCSLDSLHSLYFDQCFLKDPMYTKDLQFVKNVYSKGEASFVQVKITLIQT